MNLWIIFLTGLTTGGLTCLAMQGGLLAGVITNQKESELEKKAKSQKKLAPNDFLPVGMFLATKLISHVILGALLGLLGSAISLTVPVKITFQLFTALYMFAAAANLLELHPIFRYVVIQPPKFLQKKVRHLSKQGNWFSPAILGIFTIFIPCGVTQAMEVLAINTGNPLQGALIMGTFVLGTSPLFALIGVATSKLSHLWHERFMKIAAVSLILMSVYALNGILVVVDAPVSVQKVVAMIKTVRSYEAAGLPKNSAVAINQGTQKAAIKVLSNGYQPNRLTVKKGIPVELTLTSDNVYSCASAFVFREFGISTLLKPTDQKTFTFTPNRPGKYTFSCSMGMYSGVLEVI